VRRKALYAALYLSEGAPIGFLWWFLPARLRVLGVPLVDITTLTGMLALPWACKVFWAPLLDRWRGPRWGYGSWMLLAQALMGLALLPLGWLDLRAQYPWVFVCCLVHTVCAATQDVAIDAQAIATTPPGELGAVNGWMQAGKYAGRSLFGGLALMVAREVGMPAVILALTAVIWTVGVGASLTGMLRSPPPPRSASPFFRRLGRALWHRRILYGLLFAALAGAGFEGLGGVASAYLVDRGYDEAGIGVFLGTAAIACLVCGALLGGRLADHFGSRRVSATGLLTLAVVAPLVGFMPAGRPLFLLLGLYYLVVGTFVAATYALFMDMTDPVVAATQFTAFMAATNLCESWSVGAVGWIAEWAGCTGAFVVLAALSLFALPLLRGLKRAESPA